MAEYIEREALWRAFEYEPFYDNADRDEIVLPKIDAFPAADVVEVEAVKEWLYKIALNNVGVRSEDVAAVCEEIASRMDGLRLFAKERRNDGNV